MLLDPDDRLAEVEAGIPQRRRVVGHVGVAAPDVEATTGTQDAGRVPEPRREQRRELVVGHEVVRERVVLGAQLPVGRLRLLGMAGEVERLVMGGGRAERGEARGDGVVGPRLDLHVVWWVGGEQRDGRAVEQPVEVRDAAGIAAQQPVVAEQPQVAGLGRRLVRWRRDVVGVDETRPCTSPVYGRVRRGSSEGPYGCPGCRTDVWCSASVVPGCHRVYRDCHADVEQIQ